jgi:hypothetical protein
MESVKEVLDSNPKRQYSSCKVMKNMLWDNQFGCLSKICNKCSNSEPIPEHGEVRCSSCKVVRHQNLFWDSKGTTTLKTCRACRDSKKKYRDKKRVEEKESSIKS